MNKKLLSFDALLLLLLVIVRVRVDTLATVAVGRPTELVAQLPVFGKWLSPEAMRMLTDWMADPLSTLMITGTFGLTLIYLLLDVWANWPSPVNDSQPKQAAFSNSGEGAGLAVVPGDEPAGSDPTTMTAPYAPVPPGSRRERIAYRGKMVILCLIIALITGGSAMLLIGLRHISGPATYAHDGGVLMAESAIGFILDGKNPYVETFRGTPMEKAFPNGPGLSHYPYLPWAFLSSIPFYLTSQAMLGWYDQRFVYLLVFALTLFLVPKLANRLVDKLALVMLIGLNPVMGNDLIYGMNDIFIVFWLVLAAYWLRNGLRALSAAAVGLAVVTKGTVWPVLPFYLLYFYRRELREIWRWPASAFLRATPLVIVPLLILLPFAFWNLGAMVEDAWSYNMGNVAVDQLPIRGWGIANFVVALGGVKDLMDRYPFWLFEAIFALPVLVVLLLRQWRQNTIGAVFLGYGLFTLVFVYFSRTMNANYVGYALTFVALGYFAEDREGREAPRNSEFNTEARRTRRETTKG